MLLLKLAGDRVLMTEDEVHLGSKARLDPTTPHTPHAIKSTHTFVPGQVKSGPNMIVHGVLSSNS